MRGLSLNIEEGLQAVIEGLGIKVEIDLVDEDKLQASMNSKVSSFVSAKRLLNRWSSSDNAPSKEKQQHYAQQLVDAGYEAIDNLKEALSKKIDYSSLEAHKYDKAIKAKPVILEAIFDIEAAVLELQVQLQEGSVNFGEKEFKIGYPEKFAKGLFFPEKNYHKEWYDAKSDAVIICPHGTKGELIEIDELKIWLPKPPRDKKKILFHDLPKKEQYWRRQVPPENITPDNSDKYHEYIMEEYRRRREGVWFYNNGKPVYLTGHFYFALNWCLMLDNGAYMDFRYAQLRMSYHLEACIRDKRCLGQIFLKSRRTGFTYMILSILLNMSTGKGNAKYGMTSKSQADVDEAFAKFSYMFLNLPFYFRPVVKGKEDSLTFLEFAMPSDNTKATKKSRSMNVSDYLNTVIDHRATKNGSYDSVKLDAVLSDECGKWESPADYSIHLGTIAPTMMPNGKVVGTMFAGSTMGEMNKGGKQFIKLLQQSMLSNRNPITKKTPTGLYFSFLPAHENMEEFTDIYGVCHVTKPPAGTLNIAGEPILMGSLDYLLAVEDGLKGDDIGLSVQYRTYPRTVDHALRDEAKTSTFNSTKLYDQLDHNRKQGQQYVLGNFEWMHGQDSDVMFVPDSKGRFKVSWMPSEADDTMHLRNNVKKMGDKFYPLNDEIGAFGCDPFSIKAVVGGKGSKGSIHGKTKFNSYGAPSNKFFLEYIERPPDETIFFEDVIKAIRFYGMPILVESNRIDLLRHMRNRGYRGFALNRLDKPTKNLNENELEYGGQTMSGVDMLDSHMNSIGAWIQKYVGYSTNEEFRPIDEMGDMVFDDTIRDWLAFDPTKRTLFDATISSGLAIMACQKEKYKPAPKKKDTAKVAKAVLRKFSNKGSIGTLYKPTQNEERNFD